MTHSFLERIGQPEVDLANDREESVPFNVHDATSNLEFPSSQMFSMLFHDSLGTTKLKEMLWNSQGRLRDTKDDQEDSPGDEVFATDQGARGRMASENVLAAGIRSPILLYLVFVSRFRVFPKDIRKKYSGDLCARLAELPFSATNLGFFRKIFGRSTVMGLLPSFGPLLVCLRMISREGVLDMAFLRRFQRKKTTVCFRVLDGGTIKSEPDDAGQDETTVSHEF
ncbi:hypothetical protein F2Q68_00025712 [Brassica cretica]|uniref:Uncharacterized protein n=1 Tax=Brassica cretica TaxID=69181 RepID=A0A8S9IGK1_BRACR|nr:hypothetical protein F2Q68_00025712 [Brassica cretica]